ncbi:MAG: YeiH family putative sulfate export transporter [Aeromonadales bacterium]|nr:YeiH family putative sulfate export transporter [Aeromonadales bacterium]
MILNYLLGIIVCLIIAILSYILGNIYPIVGGPIFAIVIGMIVALFWSNHGKAQTGIKFVSKHVLQYAVVLLGFGLNLNVILTIGQQSLPIILSTIATSLLISFILCKLMNMPTKLCTLIGVGSSICGGSAIAAAAPVIHANDEEIGQAIAVIFFFNVVAALVFPYLGDALGMSHTADAFGLFAGTAVNDTSSVTATASTWDSMFNLGHGTLDHAVTVKLTRTLAIIPITLCLSVMFSLRHEVSVAKQSAVIRIAKLVPKFIILFLIASIITTVCVHNGVDPSVFKPAKEISLFFIVMAMSAIGLNCNIVALVKTGAKPIFLGLSCWIAITLVCLWMMKLNSIW